MNPLDAVSTMIRAAEERDVANGLAPGAADSFARFLEDYAGPWIRGEAALSLRALALPAASWTRKLRPGEQAERDTARLWLSQEARALMAAEMSAVGDREVSLVLTPEPDGRYGQPLVCFRGHQTGTFHRRVDCDHPRALFLHSHPGESLEPSEHDLRTMNLLLTDEVGFGIVDRAAERLYLMREPGPPRLAGHVGPPAAEAQASAPRSQAVRAVRVAASTGGSTDVA